MEGNLLYCSLVTDLMEGCCMLDASVVCERCLPTLVYKIKKMSNCQILLQSKYPQPNT